MKTDFIPVDYDYFDLEGRNYARVFGRDSKGKRLCIIDSCPIYLWAILEQKISDKQIKSLIKKIETIKLDLKGRHTKVEKVELHNKNFLGQKVKALKIFATNYKDLHDIADRLALPGIVNRRGYDLGFTTHYIIDRQIKPMHWYEIEGEVLHNSSEFGGIDSILDVDLCISMKKFKELPESEKEFKPSVLCYDIEADEIKIGQGEILMISIVSDKIKKVISSRYTRTRKQRGSVSSMFCSENNTKVSGKS